MLQRFSADMQIVHPNSGGNAIPYNRGSAREGKRNINAANNLGSGLVVIQKRKSHVAVSKYTSNNEGIFSEGNSPRDQLVIASGMSTEEHQEYINAITNTANSIETHNSKSKKRKLHLQGISIQGAINNNQDVFFMSNGGSNINSSTAQPKRLKSVLKSIQGTYVNSGGGRKTPKSQKIKNFTTSTKMNQASGLSVFTETLNNFNLNGVEHQLNKQLLEYDVVPQGGGIGSFV